MATPITLAPNVILRQVAQSMNGKTDDIVVTIPDITTWGDAVDKSMSALNKKSEDVVFLFPPRSRKVKEELRKMARQSVAEPNPLPLRIRNAQNAEELPSPKKPSTAAKIMLKENAKIMDPRRDPYVTIKATVDERF